MKLNRTILRSKNENKCIHCQRPYDSENDIYSQKRQCTENDINLKNDDIDLRIINDISARKTDNLLEDIHEQDEKQHMYKNDTK